MSNSNSTCILCRGAGADQELRVVQVWEDSYWRMTASLDAEVLGFSYLEPKRHIPHITDLDGEEARTLGEVLARMTSALREETGADLVYIYVFGGGVPHLHFHLAPHREGDALNTQVIKGEISEENLESGVTRYVSADFPPLPEQEQRTAALRIRQRLSSFRSGERDG
jgi:diadenosine tetraphosphate (Ap4A) HIT family hydrolase